MKDWFKHIKIIKDSYELYASETGYKKIFMANVIDAIFIYIFVLLTTILLGIASGVNTIVTVVFSLSALVPTSILLYKKFKGNYDRLKAHAFEKICREKIKKKLNSVPPCDFPTLLTELLIENKIFSNIVIKRDYMEGIGANSRYAIGYNVLSLEDETSLDTLEDFLEKVRTLGFKDIIFFTNTEFQDKCYELKDSFKDINIYLVDGKYMIKMALCTHIKPDDAEIENIMKKRYEHRLNMTKLKKNSLICTEKAKGFFSYAIVFSILAFIIKNFSVYYMGIAVTLFMLGLVIYFAGRDRQNTSDDIMDIIKGVDSK